MPGKDRVEGRRWIFADCEYLERGRQLRVQGAAVRMEAKPLDVLQVLLERPAEVLTKDQLLGEVWEVATSDQSLATAISKLRKVFGGARDRILLSVPGVGYRMAVPVVCMEDRTAEPASLSLSPGDPIPFREQWRAVRPLDLRTPHMVWVAEQRRTGEERVFKFATDGIRLRALQREVTLSRMFAALFPASKQFVRISEWNFEEAPFFTEASFAGRNLAELVASPEFSALLTDARALLVAQVARAMAAAHSVGVLHNDLKPSNILFMESDSAAERWQIRVVDFGIAIISDFARLHDLDLTDHGEFADSATPRQTSSRGTALYLAPELRRPDAQPDTRSDVYALGVILYQVLCGDMQAPLSLGWEEHILDPLLRDDIEAACQLNPDRRLSSPAELAQRLERLPERRAEQQQRERDQQERQQLEHAVMQARVRQPWIIATAAVLLLGICSTAWFFVRATRERNQAVRQGETLAAMNRFLTVDLLSQANPDAAAHRTPAQQVTLLQAISQARSSIDRRFAHAPEIAARIHLALANAYGALSSFPDSEREYRAAAERFEQDAGTLSQDALAARLRGITVLAVQQTPQTLAAFNQQLKELRPRLQAVPNPSPELQGWEAMADTAELMANGGPAVQAIPALERAIQRARQTPGFNASLLTAMRLRISGIYLIANRGEGALSTARAAISDITRDEGADSPNLTPAKLYVEQALFLLHRYPEVKEASATDYPRFLNTYGPLSRYTLSAEDMLAQSEGALGQRTESAHEWLAMYDATRGTPSAQYFTETAIVSAGQEECHGAHYAEGERHLEQGLAEITAQGGPKALNYSVGSLALAECILAQQEDGTIATPALTLAHIRQLLTQVNLDVIASFAGTSTAPANFDLAQARLAFRENNTARAAQLAAKAKPELTTPDADPWELDRFQRLQKSLAQRKT